MIDFDRLPDNYFRSSETDLGAVSLKFCELAVLHSYGFHSQKKNQASAVRTEVG